MNNFVEFRKIQNSTFSMSAYGFSQILFVFFVVKEIQIKVSACFCEIT